MKKLLNTLFVTRQGASVVKEGENVLVRADDEVLLRVPVHGLGGLVTFGQVWCSPQLLHLCAERGVGVSFHSENGRFLARVSGPVCGNVLLRRTQYRWADDVEKCTEIAKHMLTGKLANARHVLLRARRDHEGKTDVEALEDAARRLADCLSRLRGAAGLDELRGIEGEGAGAYFGAFDALITNQDKAFRFTGRSRRPPLDAANCLLSFLYTLLAHDARSALEGVGLDPSVGFLHRDRPGRQSLALDLMEELRPVLADRVALNLMNLGQLRARDFRHEESGAVLLSDEARKLVLVAYQKRKQEEILHPFLQEKLELGLLCHVQALLLARRLRGDLDGYPAFLWR
ncbi:CRISPR-associated protein, Cas1 family [Humidesulfovibrio mexicanus]|uniref:CRISPR-associated endonuclease Cas1 n=1 Tax=Humidesulfovibrio mexicanus TaxID=147047 RepID=A0A239AJM5_9BACT|nr:type I-C CRISPR-associated endonuclease Cas1c [Humidesulfovibrio mexicanus]SNR95877.1 CRISPR-associated protein, Cas1 family [Humidesulfovibrio mexicanus]